MLNSFGFSVLIGILLGFLAGLGIGGGSLLILWLTVVLGFEQEAARGINLLFFLPAAGINTLFRLKNRSLPFRKIIPAVLSGCISAAAAVWLGRYLHAELLKKIFGCLLIFTSIRELLYKSKRST